jgi:hypothetical protein
MEVPKPLTEEQRNQVRAMLKQLGEASVKRSTRSVRTPRKSSKHLALKYMKKKVQENPFDDVEAGQTIEGVDLPPICNTMPVVQRVRLMLMPLHYDDIEFERDDIIKMAKEDLGADLSIADGGTQDTLRFVVESNPPIKILYVYLQPGTINPKKYMLLNWMYAM